jgi:hypothetical protein
MFSEPNKKANHSYQKENYKKIPLSPRAEQGYIVFISTH